VLDGQNVVVDLVKTRVNSGSAWSATSAATYLMGASGPMYRRPANAADVRWYAYDGGGNVVGEIDPAGNVTSGKKHDVFGLARSGGSGAAASRHGWQGGVGHVGDGETGLVYIRARYYAPELGRFQSEDPGRHTENWYAYCGNDPVNRSDDTGKVFWLIVGSLCSGLIAGIFAFIHSGGNWTTFWKAVSVAAVTSLCAISPLTGAFVGSEIGEWMGYNGGRLFERNNSGGVKGLLVGLAFGMLGGWASGPRILTHSGE
jgi:RHS repeat-associated protein